MYTAQESSKIKQSFWTTFGQYMSPILSADGLKVNWVNYKTSVPYISFKMDADNKQAIISILLTHSDIGIQQLYFEQFEQLRKMLELTLKEEWFWKPPTPNEYGKPLSSIYKELNGVSIYRQEDWPMLISFFKERIIGLDEFWNNARYALESLA